jgi:hypothetical protein
MDRSITRTTITAGIIGSQGDIPPETGKSGWTGGVDVKGAEVGGGVAGSGVAVGIGVGVNVGDGVGVGVKPA